jgi:transcriptional regulator with XRE-family HTH domain
MAMNLRSMLSVLRTLGKHRLIADGITSLKDECEIISASARVLQDWPKNFIELLMDLGERFPANGRGGVRKQFESIYHVLFKNRAIKPSEQADFLRVAFLEFAMNHWDRGFADSKLLKRLRGNATNRFITQSEFAAKAGIALATASRWLKDKKTPSRRVQCGKSERIVVDFSHNTVPRTAPGKTYWERDAAKRMGLSVGVLRALKNSGVFAFNHLLPTKGGYHELDMNAFTAKLLALAPPQGQSVGGTVEAIGLKAVLDGRHDSPTTKVEVIRALLDGSLAIVGNNDGTIPGLFIDGAECRRLVLDARTRGAGGMVLAEDVEKLIHCDAETIPGLVQMGLLKGKQTPTGLRITPDSVETFGEKYVSLAAIASSIGTTSSRGLMRCCSEAGIQLLLVPRGGRKGQQPFIRVQDRPSLMQLKASKAKPEPASESVGLATGIQCSPCEVYLDLGPAGGQGTGAGINAVDCQEV